MTEEPSMDNHPKEQMQQQEAIDGRSDMEQIKLTAYSHGAGCGCKISPAVLDAILPDQQLAGFTDPRLLVGNQMRDDAAVWQIDEEQSLISTTDFFMPIVDDPFDFGRVAAANAISDVYAMGGTPVLALAILGWPVKLLPIELAGRVLDGARAICKEAGISLAGGHSIDTPEPIFGLAVNGLVKNKQLKKNATAVPGCRLYLTKPLGVGVFSTAQKRNLLQPQDAQTALNSMVSLNKVGALVAQLDSVLAMTDVTGFGLLGHLKEMCQGSGVNAVIEFNKVPVFQGLDAYLDQGAIPGGTTRNWDSYGKYVAPITTRQRQILADPQTSGGLLIAVKDEPEAIAELEGLLTDQQLPVTSIGWLEKRPSVDGNETQAADPDEQQPYIRVV